MTSLAAQLKKLAVPETQSVLSAGLKQASFLYDEGEAATYDKQHFYNIGVNGLQQLIEKDVGFEEFEQNLFAPSSQSLQRFVQTSEVNRQLDETIQTFLLRLSPYMQLREAHKAMEWMVHRYNVHLRNVNVFMMCVLPYHDQQPFMRALRLLKMNSNECAMWRWLEPVKKGESFLPRQTLVTHCRSAKGFLGFICDMLTKHIEANTDESGVPSKRRLERIIGFYIQTVLGVLMSGPPSEHVLSTLIPAIGAGLRSHDLPDHMTSSYMILGQLFVQTTLDSALLDSLLNVICKNIQPSLIHSALSVIVIMFEKQPIVKVPKKAFKYLVRQAGLAQTLTALSREVDTQLFLTPFMSVLAQRALKKAAGDVATSDSNTESEDFAPPPLQSLLLSLMSSINLELKTVSLIAMAVLERFSKHVNVESEMDVDGAPSPTQCAFQVFKLLENRFSTILESVVKDITKIDQRKSMALRKLYKMSVESAQNNLRTDPVSTVTLCLHHHNEAVRKSAVESVLHNTAGLDDIDSLQSALVSRLEDDSPDVVMAVLEKPESLWEVFSDKKLLEDTLYKELLKDKKSSQSLNKLLLRALSYVPCDSVDEKRMMALILSYLVPLTSDDLSLPMELLQPRVESCSDLLGHLCDDFLPVLLEAQGKEGLLPQTGHKMMQKLIGSVTRYIARHDSDAEILIQSVYDEMQHCPRPGCLAYVLIVSALKLSLEAKEPVKRLKLQSLTISLLVDVTLNKKLVTLHKTGEDPDLSLCLKQLSESGKLSLDLISHVVQSINLGQAPDGLKELKFWHLCKEGSLDSMWLSTLTTLTTFLLNLATKRKSRDVSKNNFAAVFKVLGEPVTAIKFLCWLWVAGPSQGVSGLSKAHGLQFSQVFLSSLSEADRLRITSDPAPSLPCLLLLLSSEFEREREIAFCLLSTLTSDLGQDSGSYKWTADNLLRYKEEVCQDAGFLPQVLKNIFEGDDAALRPPSPKKKRRSSSKVPPSATALAVLLELIQDQDTTDIVKASLLRVLSRLDSAESFLVLPSVLKRLLLKASSQTSVGPDGVYGLSTHVKASSQTSVGPDGVYGLSTHEKEMIVLILRRYTVTVAGCVEEGSGSLSALQGALGSTLVVKGDAETVQMAALEQLSSKLMSALPYPARQTLMSQLLDNICSTSSSEVGRRCRKVLKRMSMESSLVIEELKLITAKSSPSTVREKKKVERTEESTDVFEKIPWRRVMVLLEVVQSKRKLLEPVLVVPHLFQLLGRVLELEENSSGEYLKQLILGTIYNICTRGRDKDKEKQDSVKGEHLNLDLVVQCIRSSDNPHTHQQALLLLSSAAQIAPTLLLHNMMSVFTFMGASILRQDDSYSFHVIGRILENVIPALVMACEQKSKERTPSKKKSGQRSASGPVSSEDMMTVVLRVFVEAMPHVPAHRRLLLCEKLVSVTGAASYLWRLVLLFLERVTVKPTRAAPEDEAEEVLQAEEEKSSGPISATDMEFLVSLCEQFSCTQLLQCFTQALTYISNLPEEKVGMTASKQAKDTLSLDEMGPEDMEIFSVPQHTSKQLRHFKYTTMFVIKELVAGQHFLAEMSSLEPSAFIQDFQSLVEITLHYISQVSECNDKFRENSSARFWRILLNKSHDLLDNLVNLLPDELFLDVVSGLMGHKLALVQRRALELLNNKLIYFKENIDDSKVDMLTSMAEKLEAIVQKTLQSGSVTSKKEEQIVIGQAALYGLKVLCRILGEKRQEHFVKILRLCTSVLARLKDNGMVAASTMLCMAEIVSTCKVHTLSQIGDFVPLIVGQLQSDTITQHEMLLLAAVTSLQKIIEALPLFLSPYLLDITVQLCLISAQLEVSSGTHKPVVLQKVKLICTTVATATPTRTFLPVLQKGFVTLEDNMAACAACAMSMLRDHVVKMSREELTTFSQDLLQFFLVCFDLRVTHQQIKEKDLEAIEDCVIDAFVSLVFKLSEAQFKPMLIQLYGWATAEDASRDRVLVFYHLCHCLALKLKSLFTLFAGHILKHSAETLDLNNKAKQKVKYFGKGKLARRKSCRLLVYITDCLQQTFAHDTEGFINKERFDIVMQPLVDQLENDFGKESVCEDRVSGHVVPCLGSLAAAAQDDAMWKDMNYQILLKSRNQEPKVRIWSLSAVDAFHKQLGEDYMQLVPETIPFLAELMEDDSDDVEKHTQKVLAAMEKSVGENLQEYF